MTFNLSIRQARPADVQAIAALHVAVWRATYRGMATPEAFEKLDEAARLARWSDYLNRHTPGQSVRVADLDGKIIGFAMLAGSTEPIFAGRPEIKFLYVSEDHRSQGVGRQLMSAMAADCGRLGTESCALGVVEQNVAAIAFYKRLGGRELGRYVDPGPLWRSLNIAYAWDDVSVLT